MPTGGIGQEGAYSLRALTLKGLERRSGGLCEPDRHDGPVDVAQVMLCRLQERVRELTAR